MFSSTGIEPAPEIALMTFQSAIVVVWMSELCASSWLNTVGHLSYVHGVKTLLMTPVLSPHTPVRMAVHDGLEMVVCPTMLDAAVVLSSIRSKKFWFLTSARILLRFVPSTPIISSLGVGSASTGFGVGSS